jgi:hypothetical protein
MVTPKHKDNVGESAKWREVAISYVPNLEVPVTPSAFADGAAKVCSHGLEEICLASSVATSG